MANILCNLLGHRRSRRRVRPAAGTWRSECHLCGTRLQRLSRGRWLAISDLPASGIIAFAVVRLAAE